MAFQQLIFQSIPNRYIQQPDLDSVQGNYFPSIQSAIEFKPEFTNILEPQKMSNQQVNLPKIKQEHENEPILQQNDDQQSLAFSSSSEESSSEEDSNQNCPTKIKKSHKKIQRTGNYRKYSRITPEVKEKLIYMIARQNMSIKQASMKLKINYSSAKFIFSQYRDRKLQIIDREVQKAEISHDQIVLQKIQQSQMSKNTRSKMIIKCSSGGKFEAESEKTYGLGELVKLYSESPCIRPETVKLEI